MANRPDVIVSWLQNDYGQLGRPAEAIAHALVDADLANRVAYVEPAVPSETPPTLNGRDERGLRARLEVERRADAVLTRGPVRLGAPAVHPDRLEPLTALVAARAA